MRNNLAAALMQVNLCDGDTRRQLEETVAGEPGDVHARINLGRVFPADSGRRAPPASMRPTDAPVRVYLPMGSCCANGRVDNPPPCAPDAVGALADSLDPVISGYSSRAKPGRRIR